VCVCVYEKVKEWDEDKRVCEREKK
jgi:hypothetical protein